VGNNLPTLLGAGPETMTLSASSGTVMTKANMISALRTMEAQAYPIVLLEDFDDVDTENIRRVRIVRDSLRRIGVSTRPNREDHWRFTLMEVTVS
jgi:hypothetical protein